MPVISVIVPVYKVENYLRECVDSILSQSFADFELILVDDGSPDNCPQICDEYTQKDKRIIVIHKKNGGLSSARNAGLDIAKGEYISFVDSDDYIDSNYLLFLFRETNENNADMTICMYQHFYDTDHSRKFGAIHNVHNPKHPIFCESDVVAWNKLYKRSIFNDLRYPLGKLQEDEFLIHKIVSRCKSISTIDSVLYFYRERTDSIMSSTNKKIMKIYELEYLFDRFLFYENEFKNENYSQTCYEAIMRLLKNNYICDKNDDSFMTVFKKMKSSSYRKKRFKDKIFFLFPDIYCKLLQKLH